MCAMFLQEVLSDERILVVTLRKSSLELGILLMSQFIKTVSSIFLEVADS